LSSGQWFDLSGTGEVNLVNIPTDPSNPRVFYRLSWP